MKLEITKTVGKLFTVIALAMVMVGAAFALPVRNVENKKYDKSVEWTQAVEKVSKMSVSKSKGDLVGEMNQANFLLGHYLMRTVYDAYFADLEEADYQAVIEDIEILREFFAGTPEQAKLDELLKSIEAGTANIEKITEVISGIEKSYRAELSEEEDWFLLYGEWTTSLIGDIYLKDDEYIAEDLSALQDLVADAPETVADQLLTPVSGLSKFGEQDSFTDEDYEEISAVAFDIFDLIFGE